MRRGIPYTLLRYVTGEFAKTVAITLLVVTVMWVSVSALQLVRHKDIGPRQFVMIMPLLTVISLSYTLPMAVLFGASVSYGRMSSENEIRAMEWNGLHVGWVMVPALLIAAPATAATLYLNSTVVPASKVRIARLVSENILDLMDQWLLKSAQEGRSINDLPDYTLRVNGYDPKTGTMEGVTVVKTDSARRVETRIDAQRATIRPGVAPGAHVVAEPTRKKQGAGFVYVTFTFIDGKVLYFDPSTGAVVGDAVAPPVAFPLPQDVTSTSEPKMMSLTTLARYASGQTKPKARSEAWTDFYERLALGVSPLFFAMLAVPMAMLARWKHMLTSFVPSLMVVVLVYYPLIMWAEVQGKEARMNPMYGMFAGNAAVFAISAVLIARLLRR